MYVILSCFALWVDQKVDVSGVKNCSKRYVNLILLFRYLVTRRPPAQFPSVAHNLFLSSTLISIRIYISPSAKLSLAFIFTCNKLLLMFVTFIVTWLVLGLAENRTYKISYHKFAMTSGISDLLARCETPHFLWKSINTMPCIFYLNTIKWSLARDLCIPTAAFALLIVILVLRRYYVYSNGP